MYRCSQHNGIWRNAAVHDGGTRYRGYRDGTVSAVGISCDEPGRAECLPYDPQRRHTEKRVPAMQTRMDLYDFLGYHDYERKLDELFKNEDSTGVR